MSRWELCLLVWLSSCHNGAVKRAKNRSHCTNSPASLLIHSPLTHEQVMSWNSFTWGKDSFPTRSGQSIGFLLRTTASDLGVLILIQAASQSAANQSSECWRSKTDDVIRTMSSVKSSNAILSPPNCNLIGCSMTRARSTLSTPERYDWVLKSNSFPFYQFLNGL